MRTHGLRVILHTRGTDGFVRVLRVRFHAEMPRLLRHEGVAVAFGDIGPHIRDRLVGYPGRVSPHVGDQTDRALVWQLDSLIELLGDHHRLLHRKPRSLLQFAGNERRRRLLLPLLLGHGADHEAGVLEIRDDLFGFGFACDLQRLLAALHDLGVKLRRQGAGELREEMPVFLRHEPVNFVFPITDQLERDRLDPAGAEPAPDFVPQEWAQFVAD